MFHATFIFCTNKINVHIECICILCLYIMFFFLVGKKNKTFLMDKKKLFQWNKENGCNFLNIIEYETIGRQLMIRIVFGAQAHFFYTLLLQNLKFQINFVL